MRRGTTGAVRPVPDSGRSTTGERTAALTLRPEPSAVGIARRLVADRCRSAGLPNDLADTVVLLTSELVTNAFTHGRSDARTQVTATGTWARVEVGDDNSRHPQAVEEDLDALDGRGLTIVALLAARWGVQDDPYGKTVWFEVEPGQVDLDRAAAP